LDLTPRKYADSPSGDEGLPAASISSRDRATIASAFFDLNLY